MNKRNWLFAMIFLTILYSVIIGIISASVIARDEGTFDDGFIQKFLADYLFFLAIPAFLVMHILAKTGMSNIFYFIMAVMSTGFFYAILTITLRRIFLHLGK